MMEFEVLPTEIAIDEKNYMQYYSVLMCKNYAYENPSMKILVDTGAGIPTWVKSERSLHNIFPDAIKTEHKAIIRGFGGMQEVTDVYLLPQYRLSDKKGNSVIIHNMPITVANRDFSFDMLISFTTLLKMNYSFISYVNRKEYKEISPIFRLFPHKNEYYMGIHYLNYEYLPKDIRNTYPDSSFVYTAYVFTQG